VRGDLAWMQRALGLAARGAGHTSPNPLVGCVLVRDGELLSEGWHRKVGGLHAEREALAALIAAGGTPEGATAYVTLEPCDHYGRTAPCSQALIDAGIRRVVIGVGDPNPLVDGGGIERLRKAGVEVVVGCEEARCREVNTEFFDRIRGKA